HVLPGLPKQRLRLLVLPLERERPSQVASAGRRLEMDRAEVSLPAGEGLADEGLRLCRLPLVIQHGAKVVQDSRDLEVPRRIDRALDFQCITEIFLCLPEVTLLMTDLSEAQETPGNFRM